MSSVALQRSTKPSKTKRKHGKTNSRAQLLGPAPTDIYNLENEIRAVTQETKEPESLEFKCTDIKQAKAVLQQGNSVKISLPKHMTPLEIVKIAKSLGLSTKKIQKVLGSSTVIKQLIDTHVKKGCDGYLKQCTRVTALKYNDRLIPRVRIKMNLDYKTTVTEDSQFGNKFANELSQKVFKSQTNIVQIVDVREGSVEVVVAVIAGLAGLAILGVIGLCIHVRCRRKRRRNNNAPNNNVANDNNNVANNNNNNNGPNNNEHLREPQELYLRQLVYVHKSGIRYSGQVIGTFVDNDDINEENVRIEYWNDPGEKHKIEEFSIRDRRIEVRDGDYDDYDSEIEGSLIINQNESYIEAHRKPSYSI